MSQFQMHDVHGLQRKSPFQSQYPDPEVSQMQNSAWPGQSQPYPDDGVAATSLNTPYHTLDFHSSYTSPRNNHDPLGAAQTEEGPAGLGRFNDMDELEPADFLDDVFSE
jgi:hypothetical protein